MTGLPKRRSRGHTAVLIALLGVPTATSGCKGSGPAPPPFQLFVRVEGEPGQKVVGAMISRGTVLLGTTGAEGRAMLTLNGVDGEAIDVTVRCPDAFTSPPRPTSLRLARFADRTMIPEYSVVCPPTLRRVVVAVRAENGPNLPVVYLNRPVTRTDASGAAHFVLEVAPGALFQVTLDTSENARLKPASPSRSFTAPAHDDILVVDVRFEVDTKKPSGVPRAVN